MNERGKNWTIGIVCEGPTDYLILNGVIRKITGCENDCLRIHPEESLGQKGIMNGWKGVMQWCRKKNVEEDGYRISVDGISMDLLVVHLDGDVSRAETNRSVHCLSECLSARNCPFFKTKDPLQCDIYSCPVSIPCPLHEQSSTGYASHLSRLILRMLNPPDSPESVRKKICPVIPCDSTEAWIVAACDQIPETESIIDPWQSVIAAQKAGNRYGCMD